MTPEELDQYDHPGEKASGTCSFRGSRSPHTCARIGGFGACARHCWYGPAYPGWFQWRLVSSVSSSHRNTVPAELDPSPTGAWLKVFRSVLGQNGAFQPPPPPPPFTLQPETSKDPFILKDLRWPNLCFAAGFRQRLRGQKQPRLHKVNQFLLPVYLQHLSLKTRFLASRWEGFASLSWE